MDCFWNETKITLLQTSMMLFKQSQIISKISHNGGTSFCNELYLNGLKYIFQKNLDTKMFFLHIPFSKNIDDFNSFSKQILYAIVGI